MEEMLKSWFPNIKPQRNDQANTAVLMEETTPSKKSKVNLSKSCYKHLYYYGLIENRTEERITIYI